MKKRKTRKNMKFMRNNVEYRFIGLKRSGNHALVYWTLAQLRGKICYINSFTRTTLDSDENKIIKRIMMSAHWRGQLNNFVYRIALNFKKSIGWLSKYLRNLKKTNFVEIKDGSLIGYRYKHDWNFYNIKRKELMKTNFYSIKNDKTLVINIEDEDLKNVETKIKRSIFYPNHKMKKIVNVLILRDPYNLFASRIRIFSFDDLFENDLINVWISYAKEFLGETNFLHNKIVINFNQWYKDIEYRKEISSKLFVEFNDVNYTAVPEQGSSFDGIKYNGKANEMKILERWKYYIMDKRYLDISRNEELLKYSNKIFGKIIS